MKEICAAYYRTTTPQELAKQERSVRLWTKQRGMGIVEYHDMQGFKEMMRAAERGDFSTLAIHSLSAIFRNARQVIISMLQFQRFNVRLVVVTEEDLTLNDPTPQMLRRVFDLDREMISTRIKQGMDKARAKGVRVGRKPTVTAASLRKVKELREQGYSYGYIARAVNLNVATVFYHLNPEKRAQRPQDQVSKHRASPPLEVRRHAEGIASHTDDTRLSPFEYHA